MGAERGGWVGGPREITDKGTGPTPSPPQRAILMLTNPMARVQGWCTPHPSSTARQQCRHPHPRYCPPSHLFPQLRNLALCEAQLHLCVHHSVEVYGEVAVLLLLAGQAIWERRDRGT